MRGRERKQSFGVMISNLVKKFIPGFIERLYYKSRTSQYKKMSAKEVFTRINNKKLWSGSESASGSGSEIGQTKTLIKELPELLKNKGIKTILDIPCGDFNWMRKVDLSSFDYLGADIVDDLVSENLKNYGSENINFTVLNIITDVLPEKDLIFVRDCFVHFSSNDIQKAINNIKRSGCKYLLTTTFVNYHDNHDIITGKWRPLNLREKPFNFPEPEYILLENCTEKDGKYKDKAMGLWLVEKL